MGTVVVFGTLIVLALLGITAYDALHRPGPLTAPATVVVSKGSTVADIAARLRSRQVIASPLFFELAVRLSGDEGALRAGEYAVPARITVAEVLAMMRAGRTVIRKLTVPEGLTSRQVVALVLAAPGLAGEVTDTPGEGELLPETYHYSLGDSREQLLARMASAMQETLRELWGRRAANLPLRSVQDAVVLASIVEKETSKAEERARIAAVFLNRLRLGMRLQADPTVAYAIADTNGTTPADVRPLTASDLQTPSPYNTYHVDGLPPGAIANPGRAALAAVLQPAATDELYFVADGSGGHAFARTLDEHNRNVQRWRRLQRSMTP
ncbi:MAG: endolytic transglycosylase MltG [Rhodospirillales bacterium]|nr:endolytic transglycosylase MltG [Rhodospirillales bacterium]